MRFYCPSSRENNCFFVFCTVGPPYGTSCVEHIKYQNNEEVCAFQANISLQTSVSSYENCA